MSVIGIDIGVKNLAVCQIDPSGEIQNWALIDCVEAENTKEIPVSALVRACALKIDDDAYNWITESAVVAIESQPFGSRATAANNRMRCIQSCIETWTALRAPAATVMSIGAKSKNVEGDSYAQRKKNAVVMVAELIKADPVWSNFFASAGKKRDDLADAFLIARAAVERSKPKKRRSRKRKNEAAEAEAGQASEAAEALEDEHEEGELVEGEPVEGELAEGEPVEGDAAAKVEMSWGDASMGD